MFIVPKSQRYVLVSAFEALSYFAGETKEEHFLGWKACWIE
jgi:hypothetical protein